MSQGAYTRGLFERGVASEHFRVQILTSLYRVRPHFEDFKGPRPDMSVRPKAPEKESQIKHLRFSLRPKFICDFHAASKYGRRVEDRLLCDTNNCPEHQPAQKSQSLAMQNRSLPPLSRVEEISFISSLLGGLLVARHGATLDTRHSPLDTRHSSRSFQPLHHYSFSSCHSIYPFPSLQPRALRAPSPAIGASNKICSFNIRPRPWLSIIKKVRP